MSTEATVREMAGEVETTQTEMEKMFAAIPDEKLPEMIKEKVDLVEAANKALKEAERRKQEAEAKVKNALDSANQLISKADALENKERFEKIKHRFLGKEFFKKADAIAAINQDIGDLIALCSDSADAQKCQVEIQQAVMDSQEAILVVQQKQMEYQKNIAEAQKYLYGFCAYNKASADNVLINLSAIIHGASKEELGEMAMEQLQAVAEQIKNNENMAKKIKENRERILYLQQAEEALSDEIRRQREEQEARLDAGDLKDEEHDARLDAGDRKDEEHDARLDAGDRKDEEHDARLDAGDAKDDEQDTRLAELELQVAQLSKQLEAAMQQKANKAVIYGAYAIGIAAVVLAVVQYFI